MYDGDIPLKTMIKYCSLALFYDFNFRRRDMVREKRMEHSVLETDVMEMETIMTQHLIMRLSLDLGKKLKSLMI